jgi:hypothetical protein
MKWISVKDALPEDGQAVLARYNRDNWHLSHTLSNKKEYTKWRWVAVQFRLDSNTYNPNNKTKYVWKEFGPLSLFGQEVSHWAAITEVKDI